MKNTYFNIFKILLIYFLLFSFSNLYGAVEVIKSDRTNLNVEFSLDEYTNTKKEIDGNVYDIVKLSSQSHPNESGVPDLPVIYFYCVVPKEGFELRYKIGGIKIAENISISPVVKMNPINGKLEAKFEKSSFDGSKFYPDIVVKVLNKGYIRDVLIAKIGVFPFQWKRSISELRIIEKIDIEINFNCPVAFDNSVKYNLTEPFDRLLKELVVNYDLLNNKYYLPSRKAISIPSKLYEADGTEAFRLKVPIDKTGVYRIYGRDLKDAGLEIEGLASHNIKFTNLLSEIPLKISNNMDFTDDDYLDFFGSALDIVYTDTNVYWLSVDPGNRQRIETQSGLVSGLLDIPEKYFKINHFEENEEIWELISNRLTDDNWQWKKLTLEDTGQFMCELNYLADSAEDCIIRVEIGGFTSLADSNPDHHTKFELNGKIIGDFLWDGNVKKIIEIPVSREDLIEGENEINITEVNDLGLITDVIYVNWIEIDCWHTFNVNDNELFLKPFLNGRFELLVSGFTDIPIYIYDITKPSKPVEIIDFTMTNTGEEYSVSFDYDFDPDSHFYIFSESKLNSVKDFIPYEGSDLKSTSNRADYLIITHEDFYEASLKLAEYRRSTGKDVKVAKVKEIYNEFSYGIFYPPAIQFFLKYAYESWVKPSPSYVLLVGDGSAHYRNYANLPNKNYIPPYLMYFEEFSMTPADNYYACVSGDDLLPDMMIGRIPAQSEQDVDVCIEKIKNYETAEPVNDWNRNVTLISGMGSTVIPFREVINGLYDTIPSNYNPQILDFLEYLKSGNFSELKSDIINSMNAGSLLVNYVGHGNLSAWSDGSLTQGNIHSLNNKDKLLFFVTMTCLNGYFPHPVQKRYFSEEFLLQKDKGAIACWAPASFAYTDEEQAMNQYMFNNLFIENISNIGLLTTLSKLQVSSDDTLIQSMTLFGDPAIDLQLPDSSKIKPTFEVVASRPYYKPGDLLQLFIRIHNSASVQYDVDLMIVFVIQNKIYFHPDWGTNENRTRVSLEPDSYENLTVLNIQLTEDVSPGSYKFYCAILDPDTYNFLDGIKGVEISIEEQ